MLKAYLVHPYQEIGDYDFNEGVVVYHETEEAARELGRHELSSGPSYTDTVAERKPEYDHRCVTMTEPDTEEDREFLRSIGWGMEGEYSCDCCGLKAFGMEQYGVCRVSHCCRECGCEPDDDGKPCTHEEGFSCE